MRRRLRVAFVAYRGNMRCGGQGIYLWSLARALAAEGHAVDVFVGPPYPDPMPFARRVEELPNERFWGKWFSPDRRVLIPRPDPLRIFDPLTFYELGASRLGFLPEPFAFSLRAFRAVAAALGAGARYDLVHDVQCLGYGLLAVRALGLPVVSTVHHPLSVDRRSSFRRDRSFAEALGTMKFHPVGMQAFVARRLDRIFTSSSASAAQIEADFGVPRERMRMLANGFDPEVFSPSDGVARAEGELLCVGRAGDPNKGIEYLIDALALLPASVRVRLVDEDHAENVARKRAAARGVLDRVRFTGRVPQDELVRLYRRASLVVVPSLYEGFGLPAVEAMACGTPVVASQAGALPEVMAVAKGGCLVPPADPPALARAILGLLESPAERERLAGAARSRVVAAYSWAGIAQRTAEAYQELVDERRRG
jgi:glycosyltransferase involved in cell wall biosynthesis